MPKKEASISIEAMSTIGEEIKKEKVIPMGKPARVKPINMGTLEQEQKGVTVPKRVAMILPFMPSKLERMRFVRSGGK